MVNPSRRTRAVRLRFATGAVACSTTLALASGLVSPVANAQSTGALAAAVARAQADVDKLSLGIGDVQEGVNRALVDLRDTQARAEQARRGSAAAEERLREAEAEVAKARAALDAVTRSQYRGSQEGSWAGVLAGREAHEDVLDRAQFLQQRSAEKRAALAEVERARTEAANEAAIAREASELAAAAADDAATAEREARALLEASAVKRDAQVAELRDAEAALNEAKDSLEDARPSAGSDPAAEGRNTEARDEQPAPVTPDAQVVADVQRRAAEIAPGAEAPSAQAVTDAIVAAAAANHTAHSAETAPELTDEVAEQAAQIAAASNLVGESQVPHATFADPYAGGRGGAVAGLSSSGTAGNVGEIVSAFAGGLQHGMDMAAGGSRSTGQVAPANAASGNASKVAELASALATVKDVLPEVETAESVTKKVQATVAAPSAGSVEAVIARAQSMVGTPYVWGGGDANGPTTGLNGGATSGFDCSGLVLYAFAAAGVSLPHYTGYQYQRGTKINPKDAQRGDLLFWGPDGSQHVAIYLGDGTMIEAPQSGQNVAVVPVRWSGMSEYAIRLL